MGSGGSVAHVLRRLTVFVAIVCLVTGLLVAYGKRCIGRAARGGRFLARRRSRAGVHLQTGLRDPTCVSTSCRSRRSRSRRSTPARSGTNPDDGCRRSRRKEPRDKVTRSAQLVGLPGTDPRRRALKLTTRCRENASRALALHWPGLCVTRGNPCIHNGLSRSPPYSSSSLVGPRSAVVPGPSTARPRKTLTRGSRLSGLPATPSPSLALPSQHAVLFRAVGALPAHEGRRPAPSFSSCTGYSEKKRGHFGGKWNRSAIPVGAECGS